MNTAHSTLQTEHLQENPDCRRRYSKDTFFVGAGSSLNNYSTNK